jgi:zinc protease
MKKLVFVPLCLAALTFAQLDAAVRPPRLQYEMMTLPNGLTVVLSPDHSTPIVHVEVWYHVGSKDEKAGRTGFAHLFEHMMFKGSKNVDPEEHASMLASIGGQSNAYTNDDATVFWQTVPSQYLPLVLWLGGPHGDPADRQVHVRKRSEVVKEERRLRVDNQPSAGCPRFSTTRRLPSALNAHDHLAA